MSTKHLAHSWTQERPHRINRLITIFSGFHMRLGNSLSSESHSVVETEDRKLVYR